MTTPRKITAATITALLASAGVVCDRSAYLYREPGKVFLGTVFKGQPLSILRRSESGQWARVITDTRNKGWMKVSALCG